MRVKLSPNNRHSPRGRHVTKEILGVVGGNVLLVHNAVAHPASVAIGQGGDCRCESSTGCYQGCISLVQLQPARAYDEHTTH